MKRVILACTVSVLTIGCVGQEGPSQDAQTLEEARAGFSTRLVASGESYGEPEQPPEGVFDLVHYESPAGKLAAYVTPDPGDGSRRPTIIWITGGDNNTIGDVWSPSDRGNDQSARAFRQAGAVMMFPSQRGGNDNPGRREGFLGEVDDVIAAADYVAALPHVDPDRIYLGGHSTGGTLVMLVAECTSRFSAVFALGPVASPVQYGGSYIYHDDSDEAENAVRSPYLWLDDVQRPLLVIEGEGGNWDGSIEIMAAENTNPAVQFFRVPNHDHFSVIAPVTEMLAAQVIADRVALTDDMLKDLQ